MKTETFMAALCLLLSISPADAQFPGGGFPGGMRGSPPGAVRGTAMPSQDGAGRSFRLDANVTETIEYRLSRLQEDLKLSLEQEPAWMDCSDRMRAMAADLTREQRAVPAGMSAMRQADLAVDIARNRLAAIEDIATSLRKLYGMLSPEQKALADQRITTLLPLLQGRSAGAGSESPAAYRGVPQR